MRVWLARILTAIVGIGVGWWLSSDRDTPDDVANASSGRSKRPPVQETEIQEPILTQATTIITDQTEFGRMMRLAKEATPADFPGLWEEFVTQPQHRYDEIGMRWSNFSNREWLMQSWVAVDPDGALDHVLAINSEDLPMSSRSIDACMRYWLKSDPKAALAKIESTDWEAFGVPERKVIYMLAPHDPLLALERYEATGETGSIGTILREWAKRDPQSALDYARGTEGKKLSSSDLTSLARGWPLDQLADLLPLLGDDRSAASNIARRLARPTSTLSFDDLLALPEGKALTSILDRYLYDARGETETIAALAKIPVEQLSEFNQLSQIFNGNIEDHGEAWRTALALPEETRGLLLNKSDLGELSYSWALEDGNSAVAALRELPAEFSHQREKFAAGIAVAMGQRNPEEGMRMAAEFPADERAAFVESMGESWADADPVGFETYLLEAAEGADTTALRQGGFETIAENNPAEAVGLLNLFEDRDYADNVEHLTRSWAHTDPAGAAEFVAQLPAGELHDNAAAELGDTLKAFDPSAAAQAFLAIGDRDARENQLLDFISEFADKNFPAATRLIETTEMDPESRAFLEAVIEED